MISEEKMGHIVHLMLDGIKKAGLVAYPNDEMAMREGKKICNLYISSMNAAVEEAYELIRKQKNPPLEGSPQWEVLYNKYLEEAVKKRGG